jgi:pimeloyl-ACP methyl ester carboxylesterase
MQCEVDDLSIWYEIIGDGPAILMLHGFMLDHRHMFETMEPIFRIQSHWKRIYLDLPGMGNTKSNLKVKNSDDVLDRVLQFIDKILPGQPFLIAGTSYGGYLARGIFYKRPMQVRGLLLMVPCIIPDMTKRTLPKHEILLQDPILNQQISNQEREYFNDIVVQTPRVWEKYKHLEYEKNSNNFITPDNISIDYFRCYST